MSVASTQDAKGSERDIAERADGGVQGLVEVGGRGVFEPRMEERRRACGGGVNGAGSKRRAGPSCRLAAALRWWQRRMVALADIHRVAL